MNDASNRDFEVEKLAVLRKRRRAMRRRAIRQELLLRFEQGAITEEEYQKRRRAMRLEAAANEAEHQLLTAGQGEIVWWWWVTFGAVGALAGIGGSVIADRRWWDSNEVSFVAFVFLLGVPVLMMVGVGVWLGVTAAWQRARRAAGFLVAGIVAVWTIGSIWWGVSNDETAGLEIFGAALYWLIGMMVTGVGFVVGWGGKAIRDYANNTRS